MIHLDLLPDEIYITIYKNVMNIAIQDAVRCVLRKTLPVFGNKTNSRVVYSWMNGKPFKSRSMRTDGKKLYSYALKIGTTTYDQCKIYWIIPGIILPEVWVFIVLPLARM
jgi:hypothetical protein